jgi:AraC family transcriptional regulator
MYFSPTTHGERIRRFDAGRFTLFESIYQPTTALPPHYHSVAALMFATRGSFVEKTRRQTFECTAFDAIVRPAGEAHTNRYGGERTSCVIVNIAPDMLPTLGTAARLFDAPAALPRAYAAPLVHRVANELASSDEVSALVVEGLVLELIGCSARLQPGDGLKPPATLPRWVREARDYIHAHWPDRPTLGDVARAGGVHPASLVRGFRAHLRCSPGEYIRRLRLEHAHAMLVETKRTIAEIAIEAGFYDQSHFTSAFRRRFGMTPAQLRRHQGGDPPKTRGVS